MNTEEQTAKVYEAEETIDIFNLGDRILHEGTELYFAGCSWDETKDAVIASYHISGDHFLRRDFTMQELFELASFRRVLPVVS